MNIFLDRNKLEEQVTAVHIEVGNGIFVLARALGYHLLVIHIAGFHAEHRIQVGRRENGVSHPVDARNIILLPLLDVQVHVHLLVAIVHHAVGNNLGIAVAHLIIFLYDTVLVVLVIRRDELLLAEQLYEATLLIGLLHHALELAVAYNLVALDVNLVHLYLLMLVDVDVHNHLVLIVGQWALHHIHVGILETLGVEILVNDLLGAGGNVGRELVTLHQAQAQLQVFAFPFLHAVVINLGNTRLLAQRYLKPHLVAIYLVNLDLHLREKPLAPKTLGRRGDFRTRDFHFLPYGKTRIAYYYVVFVIVHACDLDTRYLVGTRHR